MAARIRTSIGASALIAAAPREVSSSRMLSISSTKSWRLEAKWSYSTGLVTPAAAAISPTEVE